MKAIDEAQRDIIVNHIKENIFVEAGAGSGKTRSLVERMVTMVKNGTDVSQICAITFTKAAAVEFYNRFETMLSEAINSNISDKEKKLCEEALLHIDLCFMGTIDAFCNMILSENPIEAGIPLNSTIVEEEEYKFLIADEYNNIINSVSTKQEKEVLDDFLRFQYKPEEAFTEIMNKLLNKRNYEIKLKKRQEIIDREEAFYKKYQNEIRSLVKGIMSDKGKYLSEGNGDSRDAKEYILDNGWIVFEDWKENATSILRFFSKGLGPINITTDIPTMSGAFNDYFELSSKKKHYKIVEKKYDELNNELLSIQADYTLAFLVPCIEKVSSNLIKKGKLSFFDNLLLFRNLLRNDAANGGELIKHINKRHKYYLVDEFQDTDPLQSEIVFYLTAETPDPDFKKCKPTKGTLFIVGDPKQSIYRFRNADVVSYDFIKNLFKNNGDTVVELTTNFRSQKKLVDFYNYQFPILFNKAYKGLQAPFSKVDYYPDNKETPIVEGVIEYGSSVEKDPENVANIILNLVDKGYEYGEIMVLTNTRPALKDYIDKFENKHIPYEIQGQSVFKKCKTFTNLKYLLGAIANPDNSFYVYKALRIPLKLSDNHIYTVFANKGPSLLNVTNDPKIDKLVNFYNDNKDKDIIVVFDKLIEEFDLLNIEKVNYLEYLYYAKELLRNKAASGEIITLKEAYNYLADLIEKNIVEKCLSLIKPEKDEKKKENRVLVANVHKVKGLERKIVILTSNYRNAATDPAKRVQIHSSFSREQNYVINISTIDDETFAKFTYLSSDDYRNEQNNEGVALACEADRIAYVAATRAIDALFISSNSLNKDKKNKTPWGKLLLSDDKKQITHDDTECTKNNDSITTTEVKVSSLRTNVTTFDNKFKDKTYSIKTPSKLVNLEEDKDNLVNKTINNDASFKGTIVHRLLELYVSNKFADTIDTYLSIINNEYVLEKEYNDLLKEVFNTMKTGGYKQDPGKVVDLIKELKSAEEVYTELPFAYKEGNDIYNGIIDLLYKKDNKWFIVDYKTNLDPSELDKKYENQLEAYKKALDCQGIAADSYIYHIEIK